MQMSASEEEGSGTRNQIANICWIIKKAREFQKTSISALLTMPKPLTVWISTRYQLFNIPRELIPRSYSLETHYRVLNRDFQC